MSPINLIVYDYHISDYISMFLGSIHLHSNATICNNYSAKYPRLHLIKLIFISTIYFYIYL